MTGTAAPHFWQKHTPSYYPAWIPRVELPSEQGRPVRYVLVNDQDTLLYLVNQGALTFHVWLSRIHHLDRPDFVLFDLDPGDAAFTDVVVVAKQLHARLQAESVPSFVKMSRKPACMFWFPGKTRAAMRRHGVGRDNWPRPWWLIFQGWPPSQFVKPTAGGESMSMSCKTPAVTMRSLRMCCARCRRPASRPHWHGTS